MKYILVLVLLFIPSQILAQTYRLQINEYQRNGWEYLERTDPFTDEKTTAVYKIAGDATNTFFKNPVLFIWNNGNIYVDWKQYIGKNKNNQPLKYRFDKGEVSNMQVATSSKGRATFLVTNKNLRAKVDFIKQLLDSSTFAVGTSDYDGTEYVAVFDLKGSSEAFSLIEELPALPPLPSPSNGNLVVGDQQGPSPPPPPSIFDPKNPPPPSIFDPKNPPPPSTETANAGIQVQDTLLLRKLKEEANQQRSAERQYNSLIFEQLRGQIHSGPQFDKKLSVAIEVQIELDGSTSAYRIKESSGSRQFDLVVMTGIKAIKFPRLPDELGETAPYIVTIRIQP